MLLFQFFLSLSMRGVDEENFLRQVVVIHAFMLILKISLCSHAASWHLEARAYHLISPPAGPKIGLEYLSIVRLEKNQATKSMPKTQLQIIFWCLSMLNFQVEPGLNTCP